MRLELHINGSLFSSIDIGKIKQYKKAPLRQRVEKKEKEITVHLLQTKALFYKQINKSRKFRIYLIQESKMNRK